MTELEQVAQSLQALTKEVADSRLEIMGELATLNEKVKGIPDICNQHSEELAILKTQRDRALPEHLVYEDRLAKVEQWQTKALGVMAGAGGAGALLGGAITWLITNFSHLFRSL